MMTLIVYVSPNDIIDPDYERILLLEERKKNIIFMHVRYDDLENRSEKIYKAISDKMRQYGMWKLILVDDSRYMCDKKGKGCLASCTGTRNYYRDYALKRQIAVFCGDINISSYTAGIPNDFFVILTRGDNEQCLYDVSVSAAEGGSSFCINDNLPGHARYLVFDFFGKGDYQQEKKEWQLFFLLWILAQKSITADCFLAYRVYRISVNWEEDELEKYLVEMGGQLQKLRNQINNKRLYSSQNIEADYRDEIGSNNNEHAIPTVSSGKYIDRINNKSVNDLLYEVEKKEKEIKEEVRTKFNEMRQLDWKKIKDEKGQEDETYEDILQSNYNVGNVDYKELKKEIKLMEKKIDVYGKARFGVFSVNFLEFFIVLGLSVLCFHRLYERETYYRDILYMAIIILIFFIASLIYVRGNSADIEWELENLRKKVDWFINKKVKRINTQFEAMVDYKTYVSRKNWILKRKEQNQKEDEINRRNKKELECAEAICNRMRKFTGKRFLRICDYTNSVSEAEERFFYPQGWERKENSCKFLDRNIICPYYFIKEIDISAELEKYGE